MKEYQYLIGKIIVAMAIIVAAIIIAQAIGGAGESIRSGLLQLGMLFDKSAFVELDKIPLGTKRRTSILSVESSASCGAFIPGQQRKTARP